MTAVPTTTPAHPSGSTLDGNALAGALLDALDGDLSGARGRCSGCHTVDSIASTVVTMTPMGAVARCRGCDQVLITVVHGDGRTWVGLAGLSAIEV